jgi:hypothetical protein
MCCIHSKPTSLASPPDHTKYNNDCSAEQRPVMSKKVYNFINIMKESFIKEILKHKTSLHIAFIVKRGKIISSATNYVGSRTKSGGTQQRTIHAEIAALQKIDWKQLDGAQMYIFRWKPSIDNIAYSHPCHGCSTVLNKCIKQWGLKKVYYSIDFENDIINPYSHRKRYPTSHHYNKLT